MLHGEARSLQDWNLSLTPPDFLGPQISISCNVLRAYLSLRASRHCFHKPGVGGRVSHYVRMTSEATSTALVSPFAGLVLPAPFIRWPAEDARPSSPTTHKPFLIRTHTLAVKGSLPTAQALPAFAMRQEAERVSPSSRKGHCAS